MVPDIALLGPVTAPRLDRASCQLTSGQAGASLQKLALYPPRSLWNLFHRWHCKVARPVRKGVIKGKKEKQEKEQKTIVVALPPPSRRLH